MSWNVNEMDHQVEMYLKGGRQEAEEWRRTHGALPARERAIDGGLEGWVRAAASRLAASVSCWVCTVWVLVAGASEPREERC